MDVPVMALLVPGGNKGTTNNNVNIPVKMVGSKLSTNADPATVARRNKIVSIAGKSSKPTWTIDCVVGL